MVDWGNVPSWASAELHYSHLSVQLQLQPSRIDNLNLRALFAKRRLDRSLLLTLSRRLDLDILSLS